MLDGTEQRLSQYRGRVVVLQVMSTRCRRCVQIVKLLNGWQQSLGIQPVAIAINAEAREMIGDFVTHSAPEFPVALDSKKNICGLLDLPQDKPLYLPVIAFLDRDGVIRALSCPGTDFFAQAEVTFPAMIRKLQEDRR
jgi:hypothetical protein